MEYLKKLCEDLELDSNLGKSKEGNFLLPLGEALQLEIKPLDLGVFFYSPISPCPEVKQEDLFIHLMKANLFGQGTLGSVLGLKEEENLLTLSSVFPYDMEYRAFKEALEDFANVVEYWKGQIEDHIQKSQSGIL